MVDSTRNEAAGAVSPHPIPSRVVALLRCPVTGQRLVAAVRDSRPMLRTEDGAREYPIIDGVPVLIADTAMQG